MPSPSCWKTDPHEVISTYFIGPKAENLKLFKDNFNTILEELKSARQAYHGDDEVFISKKVQDSETFDQITKRFNAALQLSAKLMGEHSIPFWHPRYEGHMCTDLTMPGLLGYAATMMFNPNNVTVEASPFTTVVEHKAGKQLCKMFGYNTNRNSTPTAWGHITCDGTVANLESIWVARNLKFYPLSLRRAMEKGSLGFIADNEFKVPTCLGEMKPFKDLTLWELLNLWPDTILGIADTLYAKYGITSKYLEDALRDHSIQTIGKDALEREFHMEKLGQYFHAKTRHYSWPKGGAIAGLGSANMQGIELDLDGHIDLTKLREKLEYCAKEEQPVYAVVAVMGSTEEGAADRLSEIIKLRDEFRTKGLSFLVHADAAWGGYFASMIPREVKKEPGSGKKAIDKVPSLPLREDTLTDFMALKYADSITVDPHKAGYIPYPAGGLVYRDERLRFLVTWTSPYLTQGSLESIGVYGVEGSKPGAAAMGTWLSNQTIGLDENGYGRLLGEAAFTSARLSAHYAAMHWKQPLDEDTGKRRYICIPFNRLPEEKGKENYDSLDPEVDKRRKSITEDILGKSNEEIAHNPKIMKDLRELGSDLNINAFALNWYREDGSLNDEIEEANYLMKRVVDQLSITKAGQNPREIPLYLTSTQFEPDLYGTCALHFMKRLHLEPVPQDLFVLRNVVMSPFPTEKNFIGGLIGYLESVIREEVKNTLWPRNRPGSYHVNFLMYGTDEIFLDFLTSFHQATQRQQIILSADLDLDKKAQYTQLKKDNPLAEIAWLSDKKEDIKAKILEMLAGGHPSLKGSIAIKDNDKHVTQIPDCQVNLKRIVKSRPLNSPNREHGYPKDYMPFYLYGASDQLHISHMLLRAPNISLSASNVKLDLDQAQTQAVNKELPNGLILTLPDWREVTMQPFPATNDEIRKQGTSFFFHKDKTFKVKVYEDPKAAHVEGPGLLDSLGDPIAQGTMTLPSHVRVDVEGPNKDPYDKPPSTKSWEDDLDKIKAVLSGNQIVCSDGTKFGGPAL